MKPVIEMVYRSCTPGEPDVLGCTGDTQPVKEAMNKQIFDKINISMASVTLMEVMGDVCYCDDNKCNIQSIQEIHSGAKGIDVDKIPASSGAEPGSAVSTITSTSVSCVECAMARYDTGNQIVNQQISNYMPTMVPACVEQSGSLQAEQCPNSKSCVAFHVNMSVAIEAAMLGKYKSVFCLFQTYFKIIIPFD